MTPMVTISAPITPTIAAISAHEMMTATASPPGHAAGPDVHGAEDGVGDAGPLENAGHEDEQRHRDEHIVAHQREHAADDERQARQAEQRVGEHDRDRAGRKSQRQAGQQNRR